MFRFMDTVCMKLLPFVYVIMDAAYHETNPTITIQFSHEDSDIHITYISTKKKTIDIIESGFGNVYIHDNGR